MQPDIPRKLAGLRARFATRTAAELEEVDTLVAASLRGDMEAAAALEQLAHRLAGAAGSFGFGELGHRAGELEIVAARLVARERVDPAALPRAAAALRRAFEGVAARS